MDIDQLFNIVVVIFTAANLMACGLECNLREAFTSLRSARMIGPTLLWGWIIGPLVAWLISLLLPLSAGHVAGLILVLLPLTIGIAIHDYNKRAAAVLFPVVKKIGGIFLLICLAMTLWLYGKDILTTVGSFAPAAWVPFMIVMGILPYILGFGLPQNQRSVMAIGMSSRNIAAGFAAFFGISDPLPEMVVLMVPLQVIIGLFFLPAIFAKRAVREWHQ